ACDPAQICNPGNLLPVEPLRPSRVARETTQVPGLPTAGTAVSYLQVGRAEQTLAEIEAILAAQGRTLGGLPPWAYGRRLAEALHHPRPSEASLGAGRLRDRIAQLAGSLPGGEACLLPPSAAPRRATGPDVSPLFLGAAGALPGVRLHEVLLRCRPQAPRTAWLGLRYAEAQPAVQALVRARALHGAAAFDEIVLVSREALNAVPGAEAALAGAGYALLLCCSGPAALRSDIVAALRDGLGTAPPVAGAELASDLCHAAWSTTSPLARLAPAHEVALCDRAEALAAALQSSRGPRLLAGVYLHGVAFVGEQLPTGSGVLLAEAAGRTPLAASAGHDPAPSALSRLWPRLLSDLERGAEPQTPSLESADA
ncbi:MAG TPA: hypothetical protein PKI03_18545, partial [Pseudomonadota bacterium]|nr:hypothetical protein [Pseudomonadota bacterium]